MTILTWIGAGADDQASTPQNWSGETAPATLESSLFNSLGGGGRIAVHLENSDCTSYDQNGCSGRTCSIKEIGRNRDLKALQHTSITRRRRGLTYGNEY